MKGDFSRDSFDRFKHFRRVLMQQGRVQLDADWNEQVSILLHYIQTLAADIIGPYAGPDGEDLGFEITGKNNKKDFTIGEGRYYVNGILCENYPDKKSPYSYMDQPDFPNPPKLKKGRMYIVYLDVWERHITFIEDDDIREKALGGPDTATRTKTVWQVKVEKLEFSYSCSHGAGLLEDEMAISKACLRACAKKDQEEVESCSVEAGARYRGVENQLYRIEIHDGSFDSEGKRTDPTFKWSRENGSVALPIKPNGIKAIGTGPIKLELESLGRDDRFGLAVNDWVEIEDNVSVLNNMAKPLLQVTKVDRFEMTVTLQNKAEDDSSFIIDTDKHALLRRWDQKKNVTERGVLEITESNDDLMADCLDLENGIKVQFKEGGTYRTGDYWLIPARTAMGDVEWPKDNDKPKFLPPHGVMHHLAPLAVISVKDNSVEKVSDGDCRGKFKPISHERQKRDQTLQ